MCVAEKELALQLSQHSQWRLQTTHQLIADLGPGVSDVLALATNHPSALVIPDDKLARRIAEMQGFRLTGTAGVLLRAKEKGLVPALKPVIEKLLDLDFRLKPDFVKATLELAGEA